MNPDRGIVRMDILSDDLNKIPHVPTIPTHQSSGTNNDPREPLHGPDILNSVRHGPIYVYVYGYFYSPSISAAVAISASTPPC